MALGASRVAARVGEWFAVDGGCGRPEGGGGARVAALKTQCMTQWSGRMSAWGVILPLGIC